MKRVPEQRICQRAFLNNEEDGGVAVAVLEVTDVWCSLQISDCTRIIHLHNDLDTPAQRENALHKLRTLSNIAQAGITYIEALPVPVKRTNKGAAPSEAA